MWSLATIDYLNQEAARKARRQKREPYVPSLAEIDRYPPIPFPHLGPYVPKGWERVDDAIWFADTSGCGHEWEPSLTAEQLKDDLRQYITENPGHGFGIVESGQFQCYIAGFRPVGKKRKT